MHCTVCKQEDRPFSLWQRVTHWCFSLFREHVTDLSDDKFTQGFSDGYKKGSELLKDVKQFIEAQYVTNKKSEYNVAVNTKDIIYWKKNERGGQDLYVGLDVVTKDQMIELKKEVDILKKTRIWSILSETVKNEAIDKVFLQSHNYDQVLEGKMMIHNLRVMQSIVDIIDNVQVPEPQAKQSAEPKKDPTAVFEEIKKSVRHK